MDSEEPERGVVRRHERGGRPRGAGDRGHSVGQRGRGPRPGSAASGTSGGGNDTTLESPLYGAMVGVEQGQNQFSLKYTDSAVPEQSVDTAVQNIMHLLLLFTACVLSSMLLNTA